MGNHLAATAPSQILSVESYLAEASDFTFDKNLGSTRFMKVARAKFQEGLTVVKVFVIPDQSIDLDSYKVKIEKVREKLSKASNCIPFQQTIVTDRAALLIRQYAKHNLYDRISTRPFYNHIERCWVAFQLLCALNQMAKCDMWHGDIKSENVLITSWNWLLLTDFASYKPMYLPDDNPADFNYFFDTSRRRTCYIAPERFIDQSTALPSTTKHVFEYNSKAAHAMDVFSAGCVIAEIFTDGSSLFDLSQLLAYRENKFSRDLFLSKINDDNIRRLVKHMTELNPSDRYTAEQYLNEWRGKAFPNHFYTNLKFYLGKFCEPPLLSADQTVSALHADIDKILHNLVYNEASEESIVIVASLLLSCTRKLKYVNCKLKALHIIVEFAKHLKPKVILERFVPYLMELIKDKVTRVRASAIRALAACLGFVNQVPGEEANIFSEYILPNIGILAKDPAVPVRQAFAENIAVFAEAALKFLHAPQNDDDTAYLSAVGNDQISYDSQLHHLRLLVQSRVQILLSDSDSTVRQCLLEFSIPRLCTFFGRQKANDVLLSHMITFLNDKQDWQLRASFFKCLVSVAAYIGWQSSYILKPLLQQGLSDNQEFVVSQTFTAIASLVELGLLPKQLICELVKDNILFLAHPCEWIRQNSVSFLCSCARAFTSLDAHCYILPVVMPFFKCSVTHIEKERLVSNALRPYLKHSIFDLVCNTPDIKSFFKALKMRQTHRKSHSLQSSGVIAETMEENTEKTKQFIRKLLLKEMSQNDEDMLLHFERYILKQHKNKFASNVNNASIEWRTDEGIDDSIINIANLGINSIRHHADMVKASDVGSSKPAQKRLGHRKKGSQQDQVYDMNDEWKTMFGADTSKTQVGLVMASNLNKKGAPSNISISMSQLENAASALPITYSEPEYKQTIIVNKYATCKLDLRSLVHHKRDLYKVDIYQQELEELADNSSTVTETDWKPKGHLVAHMREHRGPIHKVAVSPSNDHFVTVSSDCTLRLWEGHKLEGRAVVNRSKALWQRFGGAIKQVAFHDDDNVVCASDDGAIHSLSVELMASKSHAEKPESMPVPTSPVQLSYPVDQTLYGQITDLNSIVNSQIVVYSTSHGSILALDMRSKSLAWELKHDLNHGLPTSFCIDPKQHWLCVGTVRGTHVCWDLRFQLSITQFSNPSMASIRCLKTHPTQSSCVISVATGNNEVSIWDIETGTRQTALWASTAPPLSVTQKTADSINGVSITTGSEGICMYTGGTDSRIRLWDLSMVDRSRIICGPEFGSSRSSYVVSYNTRLVDGTHVLQEQIYKSKKEGNDTTRSSQSESTEEPPGSNRSRIGEQAVPVYHHDVITDIATFHVNQTFLVSTARDGVVKIWK